jgi:hypothetical protein
LVIINYCLTIAVVSSNKENRLQKFLLFGALLISLQLHTQNLQGVWEGKLNLENKRDKNMSIRLELLQQDSNNIFGLLYIRGLEKNTIYGCDYFVTGFYEFGKLNFKWQNVQRSIAMKENDCKTFERIIVGYKEKNSKQIIEGNWVWENGNTDFISCEKVDDAISDMANDEITNYMKEVSDQYETLGILLPVKERFTKKIFNLQVDSSDVVVEFSTIDSSKHDSISVYFNGNPITELQFLKQKPLRIRLKELLPGLNDLIIVSESVLQSKLKISMKIIYEGEVNLMTIRPGFANNALVQIIRKQE